MSKLSNRKGNKKPCEGKTGTALKVCIEQYEYRQSLKEKDLLVICDVGAYGMSLSSNYNLRPKAIELLIKGSKIKIIRARQKYKEII